MLLGNIYDTIYICEYVCVYVMLVFDVHRILCSLPGPNNML